jgi:multidrug efflux pump
MPKGFFPQQDNGLMTGTIQASQGTSFQAMQQIVAEYVPVCGAIRRSTRLWHLRAGARQPTGAALHLAEARQTAGERRPGDRAAAARFAHDPRANVYLQAAQDIRVGGRQANAQYQYTLQGDDLESLTGWTPKLIARLRSEPLVADVNSDQQNRGPMTSSPSIATPQHGWVVRVSDIDQALYDAFGQRQVATLYEGLNQYHVVMEVAPRVLAASRHAQRDLCGQCDRPVVPLSASRDSADPVPAAVNHQSQFPAAHCRSICVRRVAGRRG